MRAFNRAALSTVIAKRVLFALYGVGVAAIPAASAGAGITSTIVVARTGQPAPDDKGTLTELFQGDFNNAGEVSFFGLLDGVPTPGEDAGLYRGNGGALTTIHRFGLPAPDGN